MLFRSKVVLTLEIRDLDGKKIDALFGRIRAGSAKLGAQNETAFDFHQITDNIPAPTDLRIRAMVAAAAKELGLSSIALPSGAGHDAQDLAQICPVGMVFVPSLKGISHAPAEYSSPEDITNGANVLLHTLMKVDASF